MLAVGKFGTRSASTLPHHFLDMMSANSLRDVSDARTLASCRLRGQGRTVH